MPHVFGIFSDWLPGRAATLALWCGLVILTIWLLLLARTRWGQARPISKCVLLSLFAHLLLGIYAYGTRILVEYPILPGNATTPVRLNITNENEQLPDSTGMEPSVAKADFSEPTDAPISETPAPELPRAETALREQPVEQVPDESRSDTSAAVPLPEVAEPAETETAAVPLPEPTVEPAVATEATPIDNEPSEQEVTETKTVPNPTAPPDVELARKPIDAGPDAEPPSTSEPASSEKPATGDAEIQTLAENLFAEEAAQAHQDEQDHAPASDESADGSGSSAEEGAIFAGPAAPQAVLHNISAPAAPPRRPGDGAELPRVYQGRSPDARSAQAQAMGGDEQTEQAVERALDWLAENQSEDGRWQAALFGAGEERMVLGHNRGGAGAKADTGITGLALLSFFGAGHTHFESPYRKNVQRGLEFLLRSQRSDGSLGGDAELFASMYCHGIAFLALSEGYALTGDARLKPFVQKAQQFTLRSQIPYDGGWRYKPGDTQGDMSQFGWQVMALRSAEVAGLEIPADTRQGMLRFMKSVASGENEGRASYRANTRPSRTMTAEAMTCRFFLQLDRNSELEQEAADFLMEEVPGEEPANFYYWYYGSLAMFQMQDERWPEWNESLKRSLLARQRLDGNLAGSWDPNTVWGGYGGRVYTTSMATMCLEVYYRYLPLYQTSIAEHPLQAAPR